jgi:hypothetical protein
MEEGQEPTTAGQPEPDRQRQTKTVRIVGLVLIAIVLVIVLAALGWGLLTHPSFTATVRDISIIVLALTTTLIGLFLVVVMIQLESLIALLRDEIKPILSSANRTARTMRGTTEFLSDSVVKPVIAAKGYAAGAREAIRLLTGSRKRTRQP